MNPLPSIACRGLVAAAAALALSPALASADSRKSKALRLVVRAKSGSSAGTRSAVVAPR